MEETVGRWWHQWLEHLTRAPHAAEGVPWSDVARSVAVLYRAAGGAPAVRLAQAGLQSTGGHRFWLQRLAGNGQRHALPVLEAQVFALPQSVCALPSAVLNRDLYLWWALLAANFEASGHWVCDNVRATERALNRFPGFRSRYERLRDATLALRHSGDAVMGRSALAESAVVAALNGAASPPLDVQVTDVAPVWVWLVAGPGGDASSQRLGSEPDATGSAAERAATAGDRQRRRATQQAVEKPRPALVLPFRAEAVMSWTERVRVDRSTDDEDDGQATKAADDMDTLSVEQGQGQSLAARVKFDLDLPSSSADDLDLGPGLKFPEWDYRRRALVPEHCVVQEKVARHAAAYCPSLALRRTARQLQRRLEVLRAAPRWQGGQASGEELDLDAWVRQQSDGLGAGAWVDESPAVFMQRTRAERSMATLLLADLSQSTDAYASDSARVIDVIRDALYVFGEGLHAVGDPFAMWGFSSVRRQHVRLQLLKRFDEPWRAPVQARLGALRPGYYTRMGAAVRHATTQLSARGERKRLLMLLTDGKPNDLDVYEGRYGLEDTRQAVHEARSAGLVPFCVTIDAQGHDYLPTLFGHQGFCLVHRPQDLVQRLTQAWSLLAR